MEFVKTTTKDKLILQGLLSESEEKKEAILHIHGMSGNFWENEFIKSMLADYPKEGISFLTVETRGAELLRWFHTSDKKTKLIGNSYEMFEDCIVDIDAWMNFLKQKGYTNIHLQGHSLGCSKVAYYQKIKKNNFVKSLIFLSPSDMVGLLVEPNYKEEYRRNLEEAKELISKGKGTELLSNIQWEFARQCANSYVNFSFENDNLAIFNYYNPERGFETIKSIKVPILAFTGTKDDAIVTDHRESMELLKKNANNCPKFEYKVFDNAEHSFDGFGNKITKEVLSFLKKS